MLVTQPSEQTVARFVPGPKGNAHECDCRSVRPLSSVPGIGDNFLRSALEPFSPVHFQQPLGIGPMLDLASHAELFLQLFFASVLFPDAAGIFKTEVPPAAGQQTTRPVSREKKQEASPVGSTHLNGFALTYPYVFNPPSSPIGSEVIYLPSLGL